MSSFVSNAIHIPPEDNSGILSGLGSRNREKLEIVTHNKHTCHSGVFRASPAAFTASKKEARSNPGVAHAVEAIEEGTSAKLRNQQAPLLAQLRQQSTRTTNQCYHDYSRLPIEDLRDPSAFIYGAASAKEPPFPLKLHEILCNPEYQDMVCWLPHGRSWRVLKPKAFEEKVIPLHFRHCRYSSFMRQVNGWGFKRVLRGPDMNSYYHELFLCGLPHLSLNMYRPVGGAKPFLVKNAATVSAKTSVPDFYSISAQFPLPDSFRSTLMRNGDKDVATSKYAEVSLQQQEQLLKADFGKNIESTIGQLSPRGGQDGANRLPTSTNVTTLTGAMLSTLPDLHSRLTRESRLFRRHELAKPQLDVTADAMSDVGVVETTIETSKLASMVLNAKPSFLGVDNQLARVVLNAKPSFLGVDYQLARDSALASLMKRTPEATSATSFPLQSTVKEDALAARRAVKESTHRYQEQITEKLRSAMFISSASSATLCSMQPCRDNNMSSEVALPRIELVSTAAEGESVIHPSTDHKNHRVGSSAKVTICDNGNEMRLVKQALAASRGSATAPGLTAKSSCC